jgi:hypothetical protein
MEFDENEIPKLVVATLAFHLVFSLLFRTLSPEAPLIASRILGAICAILFYRILKECEVI